MGGWGEGETLQSFPLCRIIHFGLSIFLFVVVVVVVIKRSRKE